MAGSSSAPLPSHRCIGGDLSQGEAPGEGGTGMVAARRHWRSAAACRIADPDLFFPVSSSGPALEQVAEAKEVCARCQVRPECLAFALRTHQVHGVWGGMSEQEGYLLCSRDERRIDGGAGNRNTRRLRPPSTRGQRRDRTKSPVRGGRLCRCLTGRDCASPTPAHYHAGERPASRTCAAGLALLTVRPAEGAAKVNRCRETAR